MANCLVMPFFGRKGLAMNTRKNTLYNVAYRVFSMLLPLVTAPYLSRVVAKSPASATTATPSTGLSPPSGRCSVLSPG